MKSLLKSFIWIFCSLSILSSCATMKRSQSSDNVRESYNSDMPAYIIYDKDGNMLTYAEMMADLVERQVVLFGEMHNDAISHWLETLVLRDLYEAHDDQLVVGCEMWESNGQAQLDSLFSGKMKRDYYLKHAKMWPNTETDYLPLLDFCLKRDIPFVGTNLPAVLAHYVALKGPEILNQMPEKVKKLLAPTPYHFDLSQPAYTHMAAGLPSDEEWLAKKKAGTLGNSPMDKFFPTFMVQAQACRDATMAYHIAQRLTDKDKRFFHFNGEMHSGGNTGICYYLRYYKPDVDIVTISVLKMKNPLKFNAKTSSRADYNIIVPQSMYVSYKQ